MTMSKMSNKMKQQLLKQGSFLLPERVSPIVQGQSPTIHRDLLDVDLEPIVEQVFPAQAQEPEKENPPSSIGHGRDQYLLRLRHHKRKVMSHMRLLYLVGPLLLKEESKKTRKSSEAQRNLSSKLILLENSQRI